MKKRYGIYDLKYLYKISYPIDSKVEKGYKILCKFNLKTNTHYTVTKINILNEELDKIWGKHHNINWYISQIIPDSYFIKKTKKSKHDCKFAFYNKKY